MAGLIVLALAGCAGGAQETPAGPEIQNFNYNGEPVSFHAPADARRIVVMGNSAIDTVISLGKGESVIAAVTTENAHPEDYQGVLPQAEITDHPLSQEALLLMKPDTMIGWRRFFGPKQAGDTTFWHGRGVAAYIEDGSGPIPSLGNFPPCTVESEIQFLRHMGLLLGEEEKAEKFVQNIQQELEKTPSNVVPQKVLAVEFMGNNIEIFGENLLSGDIVRKLGGEMIDFGYPFISREELYMTKADTVFVIYHGSRETGEKEKERFLSLPLQNINQLQGKVYPLCYDDIVAPAVHTAETIRYMREAMYGQ